MKKQVVQTFAITGVLLTLGAGSAHAQFSLLHSFTGGADGASPYYGAPVVSGSEIFGAANLGASGGGVVFSVNTDGSSYDVLHTFSSVAPDGYQPLGSVALSGSTLYGTTYYGGSGNGTAGNGAVFALNTDGSGYRTVYSFSSSSGYKPYGTVTVSGSTLYGTTYYSGAAGGLGSIYSVNSDGSGYTTLHTFVGGATDGSRPLGGALTVSGSTVYGTTVHGGTGSSGATDGVAFRIGTDGSGYSDLVNFTGGSAGANPYGALTLAGGKLYGMTRIGGSANDGTIFSVNADGTGFTTIYTFTGGATDGANPNGGLTLEGSTLFGTTKAGGSAGKGAVFEINLDGSGFNVLYNFTGGSDGANPVGDLAFANDALYGWTSAGGDSGKGTLFALAVPEPSVFALAGCGFALALSWRRNS